MERALRVLSTPPLLLQPLATQAIVPPRLPRLNARQKHTVRHA
jgi:hypothetical protein